MMHMCVGRAPPSKQKPKPKKHPPAYNCPLCHQVPKKDGLLTKYPSFLAATEIGCDHVH